MSWTGGPYAYVEGLDPEVDFLSWADYQARQRAAVTVVEADCGHYRITGADGYADETHYTNKAAALAEADRLQTLGVAA